MKEILDQIRTALDAVPRDQLGRETFGVHATHGVGALDGTPICLLGAVLLGKALRGSRYTAAARILGCSDSFAVGLSTGWEHTPGRQHYDNCPREYAAGWEIGRGLAAEYLEN